MDKVSTGEPGKLGGKFGQTEGRNVRGKRLIFCASSKPIFFGDILDALVSPGASILSSPHSKEFF